MISLTVETQYTGTLSISVHPWNSVKDLKATIEQQCGIASVRQRLFFHGKELKNAKTLLDCGITNNGQIYMSVSDRLPSSSPQRHVDTIGLQVYGQSNCPAELDDILKQARQGLLSGLAPRLASEGTGGTYFLRHPVTRKTVAVFKAADEEPFAPNNPRGFQGPMGSEGLKPGVLSGEGHLREVAAFLLDHDHFAGVPCSVVAEMAHPSLNIARTSALSATTDHDLHLFKVGSLQQFIEYDELVSDLAPQLFPPHEVHKIGILDIRMVNLDRNDANILVKRTRHTRTHSTYQLIPIDHAYSIPDTLELSWSDWVWYEWPQAKRPFDEETKAYVKRLDIMKDVELLRQTLSIREPCLRSLRITGTLLKKGVAAGLTLHQIASMILREDENTPSELEVLCTHASGLASKLKGNVSLRAGTDISPTHQNPPPPSGGVGPDPERGSLSPIFADPLSPLSPSTPPQSALNATAISPRSSISSNSGLGIISLHRSVSHCDFRGSLNGSKGFGLMTLDRKSLNPSRRARRISEDPTSPDLFFESGRSSKRNDGPETEDLFFSILEPLLEQAVLVVASRTSPAPSGAAISGTNSPALSPFISGSQPNPPWVPRQSASNLSMGFDFGGFTDSTESPMCASRDTPSTASLASLSLPPFTPTRLDARSPSPMARSIAGFPLTQSSSRSSHTELNRSWKTLADIDLTTSSSSPLPPATSSSASPASPTLAEGAAAPAVKPVPYRPPHARARGNSILAHLQSDNAATLSGLPSGPPATPELSQLQEQPPSAALASTESAHSSSSTPSVSTTTPSDTTSSGPAPLASHPQQVLSTLRDAASVPSPPAASQSEAPRRVALSQLAPTTCDNISRGPVPSRKLDRAAAESCSPNPAAPTPLGPGSRGASLHPRDGVDHPAKRPSAERPRLTSNLRADAPVFTPKISQIPA